MWTTALKVGDILCDKYKIERILGKGGFGCAYLARDLGLERLCVIKELRAEHMFDRDAQQRFINEARTMARLSQNNPRIVLVYDLLQPGTGNALRDHYIVMEYMAGGSLEDWLAHRALTVGEAVHMAAEVCLGLDEAHKAGIVHRDIKPGNILLSENGQVLKVADWGLVHLPNTNMTLAGQPGTLRYMSVEQARNARTIDGRCDLYAVGAMLFYMVTGQYYLDFPAIERTAYEEFKRRHRLPDLAGMTREQQWEVQRRCQEADCRAIIELPPRRPRDFNPDISPALEGVILKSLAKAPQDRHQSASQMAEALAAVAGSSASSSSVRPADRVKDWLADAHRALSQDLSPSDALRALERAREAAPEHAVVYCEMAKIYNLMGRHDEACRVLEDGLQHAAIDACLLHDLGVTYMRIGRNKDAIQMLQRSLSLNQAQRDIPALLRRLQSSRP